jgi:hypothetical protein
MAMSKEEILSEIRRFVAANGGRVPGQRIFASATRIKLRAWRGKYGARWADAVREAGFDPNAMVEKIPDEFLLEKLAAFTTGLGHFPVSAEIDMHARTVPDFPVWDTIGRRYGGMKKTAEALLEFSMKTGNTALTELCEERLQRGALKPTAAAPPPGRPAAKAGFVYLKYSPSLRLYKIGKAIKPDKRGAGISLLLPEDLVPKHEIKTDYPFILEKYWENRFRAKKKQGEWYDLDSEDIESFKKRREFMFSEFFP